MEILVMRWKVSYVLDVLFATIAGFTALALGYIAVVLEFAPPSDENSGRLGQVLYTGVSLPGSLLELVDGSRLP
jgi:hypothetical protein